MATSLVVIGGTDTDGRQPINVVNTKEKKMHQIVCLISSLIVNYFKLFSSKLYIYYGTISKARAKQK